MVLTRYVRVLFLDLFFLTEKGNGVQREEERVLGTEGEQAILL